MMRRIFLCTVLIICIVGVWAGDDDDSKVTLQDSLNTYAEILIDGNAGASDISASVIQESRELPGNIIAAVGGFVVHYIQSGDWTYWQLGKNASCGFEEGDMQSGVRFCNISGLAQLESREVIIADTGNHCLRKFEYKTSNVTTYAGICSNGSLGYETTCEWTDGPLENATFCSPKTLQYIERKQTVLVLDSRQSTNESVILAIDRNTSTISTLYKADYLINDFHYHELVNMIVVAPSNGSLLRVDLNGDNSTAHNIFAAAGNTQHCISSLNSNPHIVKHMKPEQFIEVNGLYIVSDRNLQDVLLLDPVNDIYIPLPVHVDTPFGAEISEPKAIAYFDGELFIGNKVSFSPFYKTTQKLQINRVKMSVSADYTIDQNCLLTCCDDEWLKKDNTIESTTGFNPWSPGTFPTFNPWSPETFPTFIPPDIPTPHWDDDDDDSSYTYTGYYYSGFGGCVFVVPCFYVYKKKRRAGVVRRQGTVVTVSSNIPHQRLREESDDPTPLPYKGAQALPTAKLPTYSEACETEASGSSNQP